MHKIKYSLISIIAVVFLLFSEGIALADSTGSGSYTPSNAISYADTWAMSYNTNQYETVPGSDCTNFISQCLLNGGWPHANITYPKSNIYCWYNKSSQSNNSYTWNAAHNLWRFTVANSNPSRGWDTGFVYPGTTSVPYPSTVVYGDLFFYDWTNDGNMDHATIYVADGRDEGHPPEYYSDFYYGALIDGHTNGRLRAIWSLSTYNLKRNTTWIYPVHINSSF